MTLMIGQNSVVSMHYTLKNDDAEILDSSEGEEPMVYIHGANALISGLEAALTGKTEGAAFSVSIPPSEAYGEIIDGLIQVIKRDMFHGVDSVDVGMSFIAKGEGGEERQVTVTKVEGDNITIDANHSLAGQTLHFDVEVISVREATPQEIEHGHVHAGGADH